MIRSALRPLSLRTEPRLLFAVLCIGLVTNSCTGSVGTGPKPQPVTATTILAADRGTVVFSDNFHDSASGFLDHAERSPYLEPLQQLSVSVTATQSSAALTNAGFGVQYRRGVSDSTVFYEFLVVVGGLWVVVRRDTRAGAASESSLLKQGRSPSAP